ncbi:Uncharacterized protein TPAR_01432 [Tolypocladium paradoxum]|uniref:Uncharacterized protein n=1 Tax=Tolypocladium paradoxum TaxID=94208 RepID=A0A2S4L7K3_9HYPO|nr:Uncharacterized protein TPAR_01432 [Tolypocladium paradoxum]
MDKTKTKKNARRVLIDVSPRSRHWTDAWIASEQVVAVALRAIQDKVSDKVPFDTDTEHDCRLLAIERWNNRTHIVCDIFHDTYDPDAAHLPGQNSLPVIMVSLGKTETVCASSPVGKTVNDAIRKLHDSFGWGSRPPFKVDHADGKVPYYANPRSLVYEERE